MLLIRCAGKNVAVRGTFAVIPTDARGGQYREKCRRELNVP